MRTAIEMAKQAMHYSGHNVLVLPVVAINAFACLVDSEAAQVIGFMGWACAGFAVFAIVAKDVIAGLKRDYEQEVSQ